MASLSARLLPWERRLNYLGGALLVAMMLLVVADVTGRYLLNRPVHGAMELTEFMMAALVFFTIAHTQATKAHIRVELFSGLLSRRGRLVLELIGYALGLAVFVLITWQSWMSFRDSWGILEQTEGFIRFPVYPAKLTVPIGCALLCLRFVADIAEVLAALGGRDAP